MSSVCTKSQNMDMKRTYQPSKPLGLAHSLHQHHHFLLLGRECRKFLSNQGFNSLEELHIISKIKKIFLSVYGRKSTLHSYLEHKHFRKDGWQKTRIVKISQHLLSDKSNGFAGPSRSGCASDPVDVVLWGQTYPKRCSQTKSDSGTPQTGRRCKHQRGVTLEWVGMS